MIYNESKLCYNSDMGDFPINPLTQKPTTRPGEISGLVDQYYQSGGIRPESSFLRDPERLIDKLEKTPQKAVVEFMGYASRQLNAYYEHLQKNPEDESRLGEIVKEDSEIKDSLERYNNLRRNYDGIESFLKSKKLQDKSFTESKDFKEKIKPLLWHIQKNGIEISPDASPEEIQQKAIMLFLKLKNLDVPKAAASFYNRLAWALWKSPKSEPLDKLVARDFLDAAWHVASIRSPLTGGQLTNPGIFNTLLRGEIEQAFKPSGIPPFVTHKDFLRGTGEQALQFLEKMPDHFEKLVDKGDQAIARSKRVFTLDFLPFMKSFARKAFTPEKVEPFLAVNSRTIPPENVPSLDQAVQEFGSYYQLMTHADPKNPKNVMIGGALNSIILREKPALKRQLERVLAMQRDAFDSQGNVSDKKREKDFQKELQGFFLRLSDVMLKDKRFTPPERVIAKNLKNAYFVAQRKAAQKKSQPRGAHA